MPVIQRETSVAAGATNDNLLSGSAFEFARQNAVVSMGITAAATGTFATVQSGPDVVQEEAQCIVRTAMPIVPDDFVLNFAAAAGDRLVVRVRNPTGGAVIHRVICQITYV
jgi:hypothetical protein